MTFRLPKHLFFLVVSFLCFSDIAAQGNIDISASQDIYDLTDEMEKEELSKIQSTISKAQEQLKAGIKVVIHKRIPNNEFKKSDKELLSDYRLTNYKGNVVLVVIDTENKKGRLSIGGQLNTVVSHQEKANIEAQLLTDVLSYSGIDEALKTTTYELNLIHQRWLKAQADKLVNDRLIKEEEEGYKRSYWIILTLLIAIGAVFSILFIAKYVQNRGHQFENLEFYSLSKFSLLEKYAAYAVVSIVLIFTYYFVVFYYDDIIIVAFLTLILCVPLANGILFLFIAISSRLMAVNSPQLSVSLSVIEKKFLLKPEITGFDLLGLNLASLLASGKIKTEIEEREIRFGEIRTYLLIMRGPQFKIEDFKTVDAPLLKPLIELDNESGFYIHHYAKLVNEYIFGFKSYKRDSVAKELVNKGFLDQKKWSVNLFKPTPNASNIVEELKTDIEKLNHQLTNFNADGVSKIPFTMDFLLLDNFESILKELGEVNDDIQLYRQGEAIEVFNDFLVRVKIKETEVNTDSDY